MPNAINETLLDIAEWRMRTEQEAEAGQEKAGFVPSDPTAGGAPPVDPAAAAPGGAPPMDPAAAAGGAPPMDPMAGGAGAGMDPMVQAIVQGVTAAMGGGGAGGAGAGPGVAGPGKGSAKVDPGLIYMELGRVRKLLTGMYQQLGWELPPDILDDDMVAQSIAGGQPAPQPLAGAPAGGGEAQAGPAGLPAVGESPAIKPMDGVALSPGGDMKTAETPLHEIETGDIMPLLLKSNSGMVSGADEALAEQGERADAVATLARSLNRA